MPLIFTSQLFKTVGELTCIKMTLHLLCLHIIFRQGIKILNYYSGQNNIWVFLQEKKNHSTNKPGPSWTYFIIKVTWRNTLLHLYNWKAKNIWLTLKLFLTLSGLDGKECCNFTIIFFLLEVVLTFWSSTSRVYLLNLIENLWRV